MTVIVENGRAYAAPESGGSQNTADLIVPESGVSHREAATPGSRNIESPGAEDLANLFYTLSGLFLMTATALMYGTALRRRRERRGRR